MLETNNLKGCNYLVFPFQRRKDKWHMFRGVTSVTYTFTVYSAVPDEYIQS